MTKNDTSYQVALDELEDILNTIESDDLEIDQLSALVKRAGELLNICKKKLKKTESDVEKILSKMQE